MSKTKFYLFFVTIIVVGIILRIYKIDLPLLDSGAPNRQLLTADISRSLFRLKSNTFKFDKSFNSIVQGLTYLEFPIYNLIVILFYQLADQINEIYGRLLSFTASLFSVLFLFLIAKNRYAPRAVLLIIFSYFLIIPISLELSRAYQPDYLMAMLAIGSVYFLEMWRIKPRFILWFYGLLFWTLALLTKASVLFLGLPIMFIFFRRYGFKLFKSLAFWMFWIISLTPTVLWYLYTYSLTPKSFPPLTEFKLFFSPSFYASMFYGLILRLFSATGVIFFVLGIFRKQTFGVSKLFILWLIGGAIYLFSFGSISSTHWYYFLPLAPAVAVFIGLGLDLGFKTMKKTDVFFRRVIFVVMLILSFLISQQSNLVRLYKIHPKHKNIIEAVVKSKEFIPRDSRVIATSYQSSALLHYLDRPGDYLVLHTDTQLLGNETVSRLETLIDFGAEYYVIADAKELNLNPSLRLKLDSYELLAGSEDTYLIYKLN